MSQRLIQSATSVVGADGKVILVFSPTPMSSVWTGSVSIPDSPSGAIWQARILNNPWGTWGGASPFGPIQCWGGEQLTILASNLPPGLNLAAIWTGMSEDESIDSPTPVPMPNSPLISTTSAIIKSPTVGTPGAVKNISPTHDTVLPDDGKNSIVSTAVYNVSNFQSLDVIINNTSLSLGENIGYTFLWYDAPNANDGTQNAPIPSSSGPFVVGQGSGLHWRVPVLAPFLQISVKAKTYSTVRYQIVMRGLATPLAMPMCSLADNLVFVPAGATGALPGQLIVDTIGVTTVGANIGGGQQVNINLAPYFGPAMFWFNAGQVTGQTARISTAGLDGNLVFVNQIVHVNSAPGNNSLDNSILVHIPAGPNIISFINPGATTTFFASLFVLNN
jgi:hypothetical protein